MTAVQSGIERVTADEAAALAARLAPLSGSVFATWEWLGPWIEHLGGPDVRLYAVDDVALVGFARRRGELRLVGDGMSDECGPVCAPEHREAAARAMAALGEPFVARDLPAGALNQPFVARDLPGAHWAAWLGGEVVHVEPCLSVRAPDFDAWLASRPSSFRRKARVVARRLEGTHIRAATASTVNEDLRTLVRLHRARFGDRSRIFDGPRGEFLLDAGPRLFGAGRLRLKTIDVAGEPAAAMLFLRHRGVESYYQAGWDPSFASLSPGFALLLDAVREFGEVSLLRGAEPYKLAWASTDRPLITVRVP